MVTVYCDNTMKRINKLCGENVQLLCGLVKLRKATISFVTFVCLSVCLSGCLSVRMEQLGLLLKRFPWNFILEYFSKTCEKIEVSLNSNKNNGTSHDDLCTLLIYLAELFSE